MESDTKFSEVRHVPAVRVQLNSTEGLPFEKVLSSAAVSAAFDELGIEYRERFFLQISRFGLFCLKSSMTTSLVKQP